MQSFYEFIQKRDKNLLIEYVIYCHENKIDIDENVMQMARNAWDKAKYGVAPFVAGAMMAGGMAGKARGEDPTYTTPRPLAGEMQQWDKLHPNTPFPSHLFQNKQQVKPGGNTGKAGDAGSKPGGADAKNPGMQPDGSKPDQGKFFDKDTHVKKALEGYNNLNKTPVQDQDQLEDAFRNPGHNAQPYFKDSMGRPTRNFQSGAFHINPYGVSTQFNPQKIIQLQGKNKSWEYVPALNMFIDMKQTNPNGNPLLLKLYDSSTGKMKGTVANFFGLSVNRDGSITPRTPQPMP